jgi:hypothetical protein
LLNFIVGQSYHQACACHLTNIKYGLPAALFDICQMEREAAGSCRKRKRVLATR